MVHLIRTAWSGTTGGPGLTQLAVDTTESSFGALSGAQAQSAVNAVRAFWNTCTPYLPDEITLTVSPVVDYYLNDSGELAGSVSAATPPTNVAGTSTAVYSMAAGLKVNLNTVTIRNGRRVRGSIFIVPSASSQTNTGLASSTARTAINTAGATMLAALATGGLKLLVWSRPLPAGVPNGPRDGDIADVTALETNEKMAILRGRRD